MAKITMDMIKELRDKTNAGMMDCKKALEEADGDMEKAIDFLRQKGLSTALKRADRKMLNGVISTYVHGGGKIGVMVEVNCETDFVANTEPFKEFVHNIALQIAAANPLAIRREDLSEDIISRERDIYSAQAKEMGKPEKVIEKIVDGKMNKFFKEVVLMEQSYIKDPDVTVQDLLNELIAKTGENITIRRFVRYQLGEES